MENGNITDSRFFVQSDPYIEKFEWFDLNWDFMKMSWWSRLYEYSWLMNVVPSFISTGNIIDIGCGNDHPSLFMLHDVGFQNVVGTDLIEKDKYRYNDHMVDGIEYHKDDILNPAIDNKFDCVSCISVLEHFTRDQQKIVFGNIIKYINDHGCLVMTCDISPKYNPVPIYLDMLKENGFTFNIVDVEDELRISSQNTKCSRKLRKMYFCYRIFAIR